MLPVIIGSAVQSLEEYRSFWQYFSHQASRRLSAETRTAWRSLLAYQRR